MLNSRGQSFLLTPSICGPLSSAIHINIIVDLGKIVEVEANILHSFSLSAREAAAQFGDRHIDPDLPTMCLIPLYAGPIHFGTMMNDYREVFAAFKSRGRALPALNWSISKTFSSGSNSGFGQLLMC
jgi:hypothetical protein